MSDWNIFGTAPESLAGLLGAQATQDLQKKAMTTGLINTALGYLVQPKNQNLGLGRILGQSLMSGMQGAQGVYSGALEDWQTKQKIAELQRNQKQQEKIQGYLENIQDPNERLLAELNAPEYVKSKLTPKQRETKIAPNGQLIYTDTGELVTQASFAAPKEPADVTSVQEFERAKADPEFMSFLRNKWTAQAQAQAPFKTAEQQRQEREDAYKYGTPPTTSAIIPQVWTAQDIIDTASSAGKTIAQVQADLKKRGIKVKGN